MADRHPSLLVTDHLLPGIRERLRISGLSYVDDTGNIFLKGKRLLILVEAGGRGKPKVPGSRFPGDRTATGGKSWDEGMYTGIS